jgi:hypothetical protein
MTMAAGMIITQNTQRINPGGQVDGAAAWSSLRVLSPARESASQLVSRRLLHFVRNDDFFF